MKTKEKQIDSEIWSDKTTKCNWPDTFKFADQLNKEKHLGRTNWRVPKLWELLRAYDLKVKGFDNASWFWSSAGNVNNSNDAWYVGFSHGNTDNNDKDSDVHVRCVASRIEEKIMNKIYGYKYSIEGFARDTKCPKTIDGAVALTREEAITKAKKDVRLIRKNPDCFPNGFLAPKGFVKIKVSKVYETNMATIITILRNSKQIRILNQDYEMATHLRNAALSLEKYKALKDKSEAITSTKPIKGNASFRCLLK